MTRDPTLGISPHGDDWEQRIGTHVRQASNQTPVGLNPATWSAYPEIDRVVADRLPTEITRDDLRILASNIDWKTPSEVERLFVHTMAWGSGKTNGRGPRYTNQAIASGKVHDVLTDAKQLLHPHVGPTATRARIAAAYALHRRLPGVGPAFFTKVLWVIGTSTGIRPTPLTLDQRVWDSLGRLGWSSLEAAGGTRNRGLRYVAYLRACESWASTTGHAPEDIEYTLFWRT